MNIWESLLKDSSKASKLPEGTIVFFGDSSCGKSALIKSICSNESTASDNEMVGIPDIVAYDSFLAGDIDEVSNDIIILLVWLLTCIY